MNPTKHLPNTLISSCIAATMAFSSLSFAQPDDSKLKTYTDPISGELKVAPKLLSQMSEAEKAILTTEEKQILKKIEAQIMKEEQQRKKHLSDK